ncbi:MULTISPECIES: site-specific integrase [unclassified Bradyrhizobium]|uniref:site-specific integrase n=1 Tax=unclassified Bradyrhizobium TaxID=2631580 RepID=UPI002915E4E6|nr:MULTISPECIES: site-specific integrase [unclassified Bradyrhizobium]
MTKKPAQIEANELRNVDSTTPLRLDVAAGLAFPDGSMTLSGLRCEITRGRLGYELIAGKYYTTLGDIENMRRLCRRQTAGPNSPGNQGIKPIGSPGGSVSPFERAHGARSRASLRAKIRQYLCNEVGSSATLPTVHLNGERRSRDIDQIPIADVLAVYLEDQFDPKCSQTVLTIKMRALIQHVSRLNDYWGDLTLAGINTPAAKAYVKHRIYKGGGEGGARRDLEVMRAAINHHSRENLHYGNVSLWLPDRGEPRDRWLTRSEVARMIWAAYRYREVQTIHVGRRNGQKVVTERRPLRHVARFLLLGCYTGSRAGTIASASHRQVPGHSFVDLERGILYRKAIGKKATKKRQTTAPIPPRLLAHLRRWVRAGIASERFVEFNGRPVASIKKAFRKVVELARIDTSIGSVVPHTLRHTAATWLMQNGTSIWDAAGYLGMTAEVLERVYGHHHPDYQASAAERIARRPTTSVRQEPRADVPRPKPP